MEELLAGRTRLSLNNDRYIIKELMKVVNAYKVLDNEKNRIKYLNRLRLRSLASQYTSIVPQVKDGHFFPFFMFIVRQGDDQRIIELNFVEDVLIDRYKDHCLRAYHFSMIKAVIRDRKS